MSVKDPAQEFAERVSRKWHDAAWEGEDDLVNLIANELRAGGWLKMAKEGLE